MPIKFRCNYCRQFLGISRAQAGGIVDCPTCGRSIRVPLLDGTLQPLPEPELNMQDAHLARALDELARLAHASDPAPIVDLIEQGDDDVENEIPQPIPEPIPIEVPIPPTPVSIQSPYQEDATLPPASGDSPASIAAVLAHEQSVLAELASLPPPIAMGETVAPSRLRLDASGRRSSPYVPQASVLLGLVFLAGMLFERFVKVLEAIRPSITSTTATTSAEPAEVPKQVTGRITFKSADGSSQPDRGARLIAFPLKREGEAKLSVVGFRPADGEADAKLAAAALQALGGAVSTADEAGQYRLDAAAGTYQLLVLSHFQSRPDKESIDPALIKLLSAYFDKPDDLLGRLKFEFGPLKVKGTGDVWDHSF